ncbi:hypothetical protein DU57_14200 [Methanosarcina mazei]|uniref:Uncharacterized protein n=1 Tax=Methanosarcina mazei TaxID=2209 RepID=A0A0F8LN76_METMZ|nr:hypothetical protein [Methanosarcina mazei]KKG84738.1 hypothetical protein DU57_14200 [Methanosarcina mazei]KKG94730.1 hypothetical protein DU59_10085 [Methanosarcina mazei]KKH07524.1 hypothetical protein DU42_14280 [Methanosarcina mazei]
MLEAEKLLIAIGASGKMSIEDFNNLFIKLYFDLISKEFGEEYYNNRWEVVRMLDSLGYCEFDFEKREVFPCPPAIVALPGGGLKRAVLTGVRSPSIMKKIEGFVDKHKKYINLIKKTQKINFHLYRKEKYASLPFPSTILFEYFEEEYINDMAQEVGIKNNFKYPASWALAKYSIGLKEYRENILLDRTREDEVNWNKRYFDPKKFEFSKFPPNEKDIYQLVEYQDPDTKQKEHWFWKNDTAAVVDRDWGKYEILSHMSKNVFLYDPRHHTLAIPLHLHLPRLLARAVSMCSGQTPMVTKTGYKSIGNVPENTQANIYLGVPPEYASIISSKLLQSPVNCTIEVEESGARIS